VIPTSSVGLPLLAFWSLGFSLLLVFGFGLRFILRRF
jgi:hypothetical protein